MSQTQQILDQLRTNEEFNALRDKALISSVVATDPDNDGDLPGKFHHGLYFDPNDDSGTFTSAEEIDRYLSMIDEATQAANAKE